MSSTHTQLRRLIRSLLREAEVPPPDEPSVAPDEAMGRYAMPRWRSDLGYEQVDEKDTDVERQFYKALEMHYRSNVSGLLEKVWPDVIEIAKRGLYPELLVPPSGQVFRLMNVTPHRASLFLGVDEETVTRKPGMAHLAPSPPTFRPRKLTASWTVDPETLVGSDHGAFIKTDPTNVTLLLVADTSGGDFLMNPSGFSSGWGLGAAYADEGEVISGGPVVLKQAAWFYHGGIANMLKGLDEAYQNAWNRLVTQERQIRRWSDSNIIRLGDEEHASGVWNAEFEAWSTFCESMREWFIEKLPAYIMSPDAVEQADDEDKEAIRGIQRVFRELEVGSDRSRFQDLIDRETEQSEDPLTEEWLSDAAFKLMRNQDKWVNSPGFAGSGAEEMAPTDRVLGDLLSVVGGA